MCNNCPNSYSMRSPYIIQSLFRRNLLQAVRVNLNDACIDKEKERLFCIINVINQTKNLHLISILSKPEKKITGNTMESFSFVEANIHGISKFYWLVET